MSDGARVALVTGAGSGMGRVTAQRLGRHGWCVVAVDVLADSLDWVDGAEGDVVAHVADVSTEEGNVGMVEEAVRRFGGLDGAILNAGLNGNNAPITDLPGDELDRLYRVNQRGVALGMGAVIPAMRERGGGAITAVSSVVGMVGDEGNWAYGGTKAAVIMMVKATALAFGRFGIRVNALAPGPVPGGMSARVAGQPDSPLHQKVVSLTALKRWGTLEEVAGTHEFLLSPEAGFITGAVIPVDGGMSIGHSTRVE